MKRLRREQSLAACQAAAAPSTSSEAAGTLREGGPRRAGRPAGKAIRRQSATRRRPAAAPSPAARPLPPSLGRRAQRGDLSACELATVGAKGSAAYTYFENLFREWQRRRGRSTDDHGEIEVNLLDYLDELLADNVKLTHAEKTVYGMLYSTLPGKVRDYPRLQRALKGYRKQLPPVSRMPLPIEVKSGICALLILDGERATALYVESVFAGSFRPGELLRANVGDLVKPGVSEDAALRWWSLIVAPEERLQPSKTQTFDDTVIFDHPEWLGDVLGSWVAHASDERALFPLDAVRIARLFKAAADKLGVDASLYQLRHGGASDDLLRRRRTLSEIQSRVRVKCVDTVRRYAKPGKIQQALNRLAPKSRQYCEWAHCNLKGLFCGSVRSRRL